ncbi:MAG TPA: sulfate ABC transporter permease subunit [Actinomycetes bacterium]
MADVTAPVAVPRRGVSDAVRRAGIRWGLRLIALAYLTLLLLIPVVLVLWKTFQNGLGPIADSLSSAQTVHAFQITIVVAFYSVLANTIFGVGASLLLVRHEFRGKRVLNALIDLPLAVSPVVVGLALVLVYGRLTGVGKALASVGINVIFSIPGMVLATTFVCIPLVVRSVAPVLEEIGDDQEQAAATLGAGPVETFLRITLPTIRSALAYGVVLALARSLGEYGAVAVVSGRLVGRTQTVTLLVQERYQNFDQTTAYTCAVLLVLMAVLALLVSRLLRPRELST